MKQEAHQLVSQEWFEKIRKASENAHLPHEEKKQRAAIEKKVLLAVFLLALLPRLYIIFFASNPQNPGIGWYNDVFHHWQIAYLSKEIGFSQGFLRLWDLKGLEYFWGALHPLTLAFLFTITGSDSIVVPRLLSAFAGSAAIMVLFLLVSRYSNSKTAAAASLLAIVNPVGIFTDASGMQEPLGILMLLSGIYFWPKNPMATGIFFGLASMARGEYWLFSLGLFVVILFSPSHHFEKKVSLILSYTVLILLYMKYLLSYTGNAIYPIWWNFFGNAAGRWQAQIPLTPEQITIRFVFGGLLVLSLFGIAVVLWKRPSWYLLAVLGFGNMAFLSFFIGFTEYLKSYLPRFWVDRIFWLPYMVVGTFICVFLFAKIAKLSSILLRGMGTVILWIGICAAVIALQFLWGPIWRYYDRGFGDNYLQASFAVAERVRPWYKGGAILIPENDMVLTYGLVYALGLSGKTIAGQMFDPFYYSLDDAFANWEKQRGKILAWFRNENIRLVIVPSGKTRYEKLIAKEPSHFIYLQDVRSYPTLKLYAFKE